jgi:hypothetical protein
VTETHTFKDAADPRSKDCVKCGRPRRDAVHGRFLAQINVAVYVDDTADLEAVEKRIADAVQPNEIYRLYSV